MLDFACFPKQWVIAREPLQPVVAGRTDSFAGLHLASANGLPILRLLDATGVDVGRLIGWVIHGRRFHDADGTIGLGQGETPEALFRRLAGRFVMLWRRVDGRLLLREDSSGGLPAVYVPDAGLVGATVSALETLHPLAVDPNIEAIFAFPARRGFLPFGLTPRRGAHRLMPNHVLELDNFEVARVWPDAELHKIDERDETGIRDLVTEAADLLRRQMSAILGRGETTLYLSGGHDSRVILAAAREHKARLRAETLGDPSSLDAHIAAAVARRAGIAHRVVPIHPAGAADVAAWLQRSGRMMCDTVTSMGPTAAAINTGNHTLSGTGADIVKGTTFNLADVGNAGLELTRLLAEYDLPDHPEIRRAGQSWINGLARSGSIDAAMMLDLARMEQRHGGWAGAAVYGHPVSQPSLQPFSGQRLYEITFAMPPQYRLRKRFFLDLMTELWPELLEIPVNRASGAARLRYWKSEARSALPAGFKRRLKRLLNPLR